MHKTNALTLYKVKDKLIDGLAIQTANGIFIHSANELRSSFAQAVSEEWLVTRKTACFGMNADRPTFWVLAYKQNEGSCCIGEDAVVCC